MLQRLRAWIHRRKHGRPDDVVANRGAVLASGGEPTHSVVLRLDPRSVGNSDVDVRWDIEKTLRAVYPDVSFYDDGYGFARHSDAMLLCYATREPVRLVEAIVDVLTNHKPSRTPLATAAVVAVAPREGPSLPGQEFVHHRVVYPPNDAGKKLPD